MEKKYDHIQKLELCYGRPVLSPLGGVGIIITKELSDFILTSLETPIKNFTGVLKKGTIFPLRRLLLNNPYATYKQWIEGDSFKKPKVITFNDVENNPQYVKDYFGSSYVLYSAQMNESGVVLSQGVLKSVFFGSQGKYSPKYILTAQIVKVIKSNIFSIKNTQKLLEPMSKSVVTNMRTAMGINTNKLRNLWLAEHAEELLNTKVKDFLITYDKERKQNIISSNTLFNIQRHLTLVSGLAYTKSNPALLGLLGKFWDEASPDVKQNIDNLLGVGSSKRYRRAYRILKEAKLI